MITFNPRWAIFASGLFATLTDVPPAR